MVTRQLESEIKAAAMSTTTTAKVNTRAAVEGMRRDVQAQIEQTRADAQWHDEDAQRKVDRIAVELATLTKQLNEFKPVSQDNVEVVQK